MSHSHSALNECCLFSVAFRSTHFHALQQLTTLWISVGFIFCSVLFFSFFPFFLMHSENVSLWKIVELVLFSELWGQLKNVLKIFKHENCIETIYSTFNQSISLKRSKNNGYDLCKTVSWSLFLSLIFITRHFQYDWILYCCITEMFHAILIQNKSD